MLFQTDHGRYKRSEIGSPAMVGEHPRHPKQSALVWAMHCRTARDRSKPFETESAGRLTRRRHQKPSARD
jgi:hypothetical protein